MKKNVTKKILVIMSLMIGVLFMALIYLLFIDPVLNPPGKESSVEVTRNVKPLRVPNQITTGQVFRYHAEGEKVIDISATIRRQLVCKNDGAESIIMIDEIESNIPVGKYSLEREMVIPASQRLKSSDECRLEFTSTYTFFQRDRWQGEKSFQIKKTNISNNFKLITPITGSNNLESMIVSKVIEDPDGLIVGKIHQIQPVDIASIKPNSSVSNAAPSSSARPKQDSRSTVTWKYKVVSSTGIQLGVYNLAVNAIIKYNYVDGKARIYNNQKQDITREILMGIIK